MLPACIRGCELGLVLPLPLYRLSDTYPTIRLQERFPIIQQAIGEPLLTLGLVVGIGKHRANPLPPCVIGPPVKTEMAATTFDC